MLLFFILHLYFQKISLSNLLRGILDVKYLTGPNYIDWLCNLRIVLTTEKIMYVFNTVMPKLEKGASEKNMLGSVFKKMSCMSLIQ